MASPKFEVFLRGSYEFAVEKKTIWEGNDQYFGPRGGSALLGVKVYFGEIYTKNVVK